RSAPRTRSRASRIEASPSPTIVNPGSPGATSTSTRITRPSSATSVAESRVASMPRTVGSGTYRLLMSCGSSRAWRVRWITPERLARPDGSGSRRRSRARGGRDLGREGRVDRVRQRDDLLAQRRVGLGVRERRPRVLGRDRGPVLVRDLRLELALERALGRADGDAGEGVRAIEHELEPLRVEADPAQ